MRKPWLFPSLVAFSAGSLLGLILTVISKPTVDNQSDVLLQDKVPQHPHLDGHTVRSEISSNVKFHTRTRVFCWIMTSPKNAQKTAAVKATWARRCDGFMFVSSVDDPTLPAINANVAEGRDYLWGKTKAGFRYIFNTSLEDYDWFLKADDDTFVVVENLRHLLSQYKASISYYIGCNFKYFTPQGYMSGGAGYALSREAVRKYIEEGIHKNNCRADAGGYEDAEMGICMNKLNVTYIDSRDPSGHGRFFPFSFSTHIQPNKLKHYLDYMMHPEGELMDCCSTAAVSFHYISSFYMYFLEYFIYHLTPFGASRPLSVPVAWII